MTDNTTNSQDTKETYIIVDKSNKENDNISGSKKLTPKEIAAKEARRAKRKLKEAERIKKLNIKHISFSQVFIVLICFIVVAVLLKLFMFDNGNGNTINNNVNNNNETLNNNQVSQTINNNINNNSNNSTITYDIDKYKAENALKQKAIDSSTKNFIIPKFFNMTIGSVINEKNILENNLFIQPMGNNNSLILNETPIIYLENNIELVMSTNGNIINSISITFDTNTLKPEPIINFLKNEYDIIIDKEKCNTDCFLSVTKNNVNISAVIVENKQYTISYNKIN